MGQKVRPHSLRLGIIKGWSSVWLPKKRVYKELLEEDVALRQIIYEKIGSSGIDRIVIEKTTNTCRIFIKAQKPGLIIGRGGKGVEELTKLLEKTLRKIRREQGKDGNISVSLTIEELKRSELSAQVIAQNIAWDIEKRVPYRRSMKKYLDQIAQNKEVKGAKIRISGRLNGAEIARSEHLEFGKLPLQTLRADIDYGEATAFTTYGTVGVKVWIYKGEVFNDKNSKNNS
jgi:small subunit ribosomal protein S3